MRRLLEEVSFRHPDRARADVERVGEGVAPRTLAVVENLLASVPDPDEALHCLERFRQANPAAFDRISASPAALRHLITTFAYSRFLAEAVSKNPEWLLATTESGLLHRTRSAEEYEADLVAHLGGDATSVPSAAALARFRRQQLLRILLRDVLGLASLADVTGELSNLADAILDVAYRRIREALARRHGDAAGCGFAVLALGKLGGKELNYSSDIDLMFVYSANGQTAGREPVSYKEFFKKLANSYTELLSTYTADGLCYRVDLRLRPDGKNGEVCISLEGARSYYATRARDWELQMLIKARISAGDRAPGQELLDSVEPRIYSSTLDFRALEAVSETRERINEKLARRRGAQAGLDIKLAPGGIRDIEFLVQCLQRLHGGRERWLRHGGTQLALERLRDKLLLSGPEHSRLLTAYQFLRNLEHRLQFYDDRQTHTLPEDLEELDVLARKMPLGLAGGLPSADSLKRELDAHLAHVRELYDRVIHANNPLYYGAPVEGHPESHPEGAPGGIPEGAAPAGGNALPGTAPPADRPAVAASNLTRYLDQRAPRLAAQLARAPLGRGAARAGRLEHFLEKMLAAPELLARLDFEPPLVDCLLDIFENSPYFSDQLIRRPELISQINQPEAPAPAALADPAALRRFFHERMLRIQSESICCRAPIFSTLAQTSDLADQVVAAAYRLAVSQEAETHSPASLSYSAGEQMMVIALGRLGMREFDLASDADLLFVIPDADAGEQLFWTRTAERLIQIISAYTGDGVIFTVDTRLRPNGREGALVQTEGAYRAYFARQAEAWEGIAYMKSRAVAGSVERATAFLHELQKIDWRRYGQTARSRDELAQMRARLEREQGARNPLKAGPGGYYDIDFILMYLRLKGADIFYKVLNTPERIDVIEQMGHLEPEDADFLRDAATLYRAVDHGLRVSTGHAEGSLPVSPAELEVIEELVGRWTPEHLHDQPLDIELAQIRKRTHELFLRIFGAAPR